MMRYLCGLPFLMAMALGGCSSTQTRTYQVAVVNAADRPVVLWLTKDGPPSEALWLTPSQWLQLRHDGSIPPDVPDPDVQLPPGTRVDIGPQTARLLADKLAAAGTIVWNGPVGVFEFDAFAKGTETIARAIADSDAFSIAGGGDTLAAIAKYGIEQDVGYISTGGGAFLEVLEGKQLPAFEILEKRANG